MHAAAGLEGCPPAISFTGANVHYAPAAEGILGQIDFRGGLCLADKAYVSAKIRDLVSALAARSTHRQSRHEGRLGLRSFAVPRQECCRALFWPD
jgi:hypothetical protein